MIQTPHFIFDFDGTIADTAPVILKLYNSIAPTYGAIQINENEIYSLQKLKTSEVLKRLHIKAYRLPFLARKIRKLLNKELALCPCFDGVRETLQYLESNGFHYSIISSNSESNIQKFIELQALPKPILIAGPVKLFGKARMLKKVRKKLALSVDDCLYIGDETRDIEAAGAAGMRSIAVGWGFNHMDALQQLSPNYIVRKPKELKQVVSQVI